VGGQWYGLTSHSIHYRSFRRRFCRSDSPSSRPTSHLRCGQVEVRGGKGYTCPSNCDGTSDFSALTLYGHSKTAQQRTIIQQYRDRYMAVNGWAVTFGTARRGGDWAGCGPAQSPPRCTKCNSPPINGQCTNLMWHYNCLCTVKG